MPASIAFRSFVEDVSGVPITLDVRRPLFWETQAEHEHASLAGTAPLFAGEGSTLEAIWPLDPDAVWRTRRYLVTPPAPHAEDSTIRAADFLRARVADDAQMRKLEAQPPLLLRDVWGLVNVSADVIFDAPQRPGWTSGLAKLPIPIPVGLANAEGEILITAAETIERIPWHELRRVGMLSDDDASSIYGRIAERTAQREMRWFYEHTLHAVALLAFRLQRVIVLEVSLLGYVQHEGDAMSSGYYWHGLTFVGIDSPACVARVKARTGVRQSTDLPAARLDFAQCFYHGHTVPTDKRPDLDLE